MGGVMAATVSSLSSVTRRASNKWRRMSTEHFARRPHALDSGIPYVSFTFDDYPVSAIAEGGRILEDYGVRGTYFVSMGLLGRPSPSGPIVTPDDLHATVAAGHELGCHTYEHLDGTEGTAADFDRSVARNQDALQRCAPGERFDVFAYPLNGPVLSIKKAVGKHFNACRGGGQTFNSGTADLNLLKACFLDRRQGMDLHATARLIDMNAAAGGWLIFATHDVVSAPSPYGCAPLHFDAIVGLAVRSGAKVLPMGEVCRQIGAVRPPTP